MDNIKIDIKFVGTKQDMKKSVKEMDYKLGSKVYYSEGISDENYRGEIVEVLKISVKVKNKVGIIETINKRNLGIVIN